jgi:sulfite reductase (NADPH) flavoprotein alpha-component
MKATLLRLHRWLGVVLLPLFALIILSGAILAFKPIVEDLDAPAALNPVAVERIVELVNAEAADAQVRSLQRLDEGASWRLTGVGDYRLEDGARIGDGRDAAGEIFSVAKAFHKGLLLGLGWLVEYATWAMVAIMVAGLFFGIARFSHTLIGWHHALGLWLFPLALLLPVTALLMTLHVGQPRLPLQSDGPAVTLAAGLERAATQYDLSTLTSASAFKRGSLLIHTADQTLLVSGETVTPLTDTYWPKVLHEGTWGGWLSGLINLLMSALLFALSLTGFVSWLRRQRGLRQKSLHAGADVLVLHASQTGTAQGLAEATRASLINGNVIADCGAIASFPPAQWRNYRQVLVIASTTGEGELPESARPWVRSLAAGVLDGARFSLLALGDRRYEQFCGGGRTLRQALLAAGAAETAPLIEADGDPSNSWRRWLEQLSARLGWALDKALACPGGETVSAQLIERSRLDRGEDPTAPASFSLLLRVPEQTAFAPGDLVQLQPAPGEVPRRYSIGSDSRVTPGLIRLTVSWVRYTDTAGNACFGKASTLLCRDWAQGDVRNLRITRHAGFHPPQDPSQPLIMVATGCGIAPFIGFMEQREQERGAGPTWLLFGNRHRAQDYLYQDRLEQYRRDGVLTRLDTLFSRDGEAQRYVTERMMACGAQLLEWIDAGAALYICGRASTLGRSSEDALLTVLERERGLSTQAAREQLELWSAEGVLCRDLFD